MALENNKKKAIDSAVNQIEKQFGKGSIMRLGGDYTIPDIPVISTGSISLDHALGIGGVPRGRVIEIEAQKCGGVVAFIDAEHAVDIGYAQRLGVKTDDLLISQPDTGEQALEIAEVLVRSGAIDIVVIDSVAALVPRAEIEGEMGDAHMGLQARLMSQALRKLAAAISKSRTSMIFTNQIRMKIGVMFGNPETTTGGTALKFYASIRLDIRRMEALKNEEGVYGYRTKVKVVKNKLAPPFKEAQFEIIYGKGISKEGELIDLGTTSNIIEKSGTWYSYQDERMGQGRENAKNFLKENPKIAIEIEQKIKEHLGLSTKKKKGEKKEGER